MRWVLLITMVAACGGAAIRPSDVAKLQPGQAVRVHVWPPGAPGPGYIVKGKFQSSDETKIVVMQDGKPVEIYRSAIHDDTMDVR